jgi:hypothetical protein
VGDATGNQFAVIIGEAQRQRRYRERAAAVLRTARIASTATPASTEPLRLLVFDDRGSIKYDGYGEQEYDADDMMNRVCPGPLRAARRRPTTPIG